MIAHDDQIHRLRVRGSPSATPALRLRLASLLGSTDLRPPEMPPAAMLFVRHLTDPLPGHLTPTAWHPSPAWEQAARRALALWYRQAVRPRHGYVPDDVPAVCFRSTAELLACLALDLSQGRARRRWWWRPWLRAGFGSGAAIETAWAPEARHVPAALDLLVTWHAAAPVLHALAEPQAHTLLAAVEAAFDLPPLLPAPPKPAPPSPPPPAQTRRAVSSAPQPPQPWSPSVTALLPPDLGPAQTALLGLGVTLHRQPARVRTAAFQADVRAWWWSPTAQWLPAEPAHSATARPPRSGTLTADGTFSAHQRGASASPSPTPQVRHADEAAAPTKPGAFSTSSPTEPSRPADRRFAPAADDVAPAPTSSPATPSPSTEPPPLPPAPPVSLPAPTEEPASARAEPRAPAAPFAADCIPTQWGGIVYLINAMERLDMPVCFGDPLAEVSRWMLLEALARGLLGEVFEVLPPDPIWHSLAALGDRAPDDPLGDSLAPTPFHLPAGWMDHFPRPEEVYWAATQRQVSLWTDDGVLLTDAPRTGQRPTALIDAEMTRLGLNPAGVPRTRRPRQALPTASVAASALSPMTPGLRVWTQRVLPAFQSILSGWLGPSEEPLAEMLLHHPGRLYVSSSHVDLVLPLDAISLPIRRAGLDRDPGWQPAFGRVILLHFD